jgi:hypothetical protein
LLTGKGEGGGGGAKSYKASKPGPVVLYKSNNTLWA